MEKIKNLSIRKAIIVYISTGLIITFLVWAAVYQVTHNIQRRLAWKYADKSYAGTYMQEIPRPGDYEMSGSDRLLTNICDFLITYGLLVFSIISTVIMVAKFYKDKIQIPLTKLTYASQKIANNDLVFHIHHESQDELGQLCTDFERMRVELVRNQREMWRMVEEEKALRAAIAHDIRTPLTTLRGYQEMLLEFVPQDTLDKDKILGMLQEGMEQIERINRFLDTMRMLSSLEEREPIFAPTDLPLLKAHIEKNVCILAEKSGKELRLECGENKEIFCADVEMILEVTDNLVTNALRFAKEEVNLTILFDNNTLEIVVADDGGGFSEEPELVTKAYYHSNPQDDQNHFGMGMYISRLYCEKHGGRLLIGNKPTGGAIVKVIFKVNPKERML